MGSTDNNISCKWNKNKCMHKQHCIFYKGGMKGEGEALHGPVVIEAP